MLRRAAPRALDADAIAVAPFDVFAPALGLWHEGLMDLLSRNLGQRALAGGGRVSKGRRDAEIADDRDPPRKQHVAGLMSRWTTQCAWA